MKEGKSLQALAVELERQRMAKQDFLVRTGNMSMVPSPDNGGMELSVNVQKGSHFQYSHYGVNEIAHRQMGQYLKIPAAYYDRMRTEYPEMLAANVNGWLARTPDDYRMVRTLDGTARAILSDRYRRIDNYEVASTVLPIIAGMEGASVESCELTDSRMYLKVVNPRITA